MNSSQEIGQRLQKERENFGWSQSELARLMNESGWSKYTQMTVSRTERGEREPRIRELVALARMFGITLDEFIEGGAATATDLYAEGYRAGILAAQKSIASLLSSEVALRG